MDSKMLREPLERSRFRHGSSDLLSDLARLHSDGTVLRSSLRSQPTSAPGSGIGSKDAGKMGSYNADAGVDHTIVTMKTRVAIRDETPHRFQVIPLRDVSKLETSSAGHRENTRPTLCTTPKQKSLWLPSKKHGATSQSTLGHSSSPLNQRSKLGPCSTENIAACDEIAVDVAATTSICQGRFVSFPPGSAQSLSMLQQAAVLTPVDMNRTELRKPIRSGVRSVYSTESIHKLIRSESPLTHTISRSLQLRTRHERNYRRFASIGHAEPPPMPLLPEVTKPQNHIRTRTMSDADLLNSQSNDCVAGDESYYGLLEAYDAVDPKSKKRHAMYTPPMYVPNFDQLGQIEGDELVPPGETNWHYSSFDASRISSDNANLQEKTPHPNSETTMNHRTSAIDAEAVDIVTLTAKESSYDRTTGSMDCLPISTPTQRLAHKSSSQGLRIRSAGGLARAGRLSPGQETFAVLPSPQTYDIIYPRITLDLLAEIDKAIEEWNDIYY